MPRGSTCPYEGSVKAISDYMDYSHTTYLYCEAHGQDWLRQFPDARLVRPRKIGDGPFPCQADWPLPGEHP